MGGYTYKLSEMHNGKIFRELDSHLDLIDEGPNNTCLNVKRRSPKTQPRRRPSLTRRSPGNTPKTSPNSTPRTSPIPPSKSLAIIGEGGYSSPTPSTSTSRFEEEKLQRWSINVIEFVVRGEGVERWGKGVVCCDVALLFATTTNPTLTPPIFQRKLFQN